MFLDMVKNRPEFKDTVDRIGGRQLRVATMCSSVFYQLHYTFHEDQYILLQWNRIASIGFRAYRQIGQTTMGKRLQGPARLLLRN